MEPKYGFKSKNDFFYALVVVAMFVVSMLGVGGALLNPGSVSVVAAMARAMVSAAAMYFASG